MTDPRGARRSRREVGANIATAHSKPTPGSEEMFVMPPRHRVLTAIAAFWLAMVATADAQQKLTITIVTQPFGTQPQFTKVDQPILRDGLKAKSNGQIDVKLSAWPEMGLNGLKCCVSYAPDRSTSAQPPSRPLPATCRSSTGLIWLACIPTSNRPEK